MKEKEEAEENKSEKMGKNLIYRDPMFGSG